MKCAKAGQERALDLSATARAMPLRCAKLHADLPVAHTPTPPALQELPCGHFMHSHCFAAYTRYSYTCPICFKSLGDMSVYWQVGSAWAARHCF